MSSCDLKNICCVLLFTLAYTTIAYSQNLLEDWAVKWEHSSDYMIEIAEAMPSEHYEYRPTEEQMTFSQQLLHLSWNMTSLSQRFLATDSLRPSLPDTLLSKEQAIEILKRSFDHTAEQIQSIPPGSLSEEVTFWAGRVPRSRILWLITDHMAHHRGQLIVYLRLKGIEPPDYRGW